MEDAYTVGIRLALEDGVSAGVAAIAADLSKLDGQIAATSRDLAALGKMAGIAMPSLAPEATTFGRVGARASQPSAPDDAGALSTPSAEQAHGSEPVSIAGVPAAPSEIDAPAAPMAPTETPQTSAPPVAPSLAAFAPSVTVTAQTQVPASTAAASVERTHVQRERHTLREIERREQLAPPAVERIGFAPVAQAVAPVAAAPVAPVSAVAAPASQPMEAAAAPSASGGPTQGDVYLDGMRVGRWMANSMARAASRPQGGATGFDARMSPVWPGSLQGS